MAASGQLQGPDLSIADISIIDLANEIREKGGTVRILTFDNQIRAYSD